MITRLQFVVVVLVTWDNLLETLALTHLLDDLTWLASWVEDGSSWKNLPMVEDGLWEGLSSGTLTEIGGETERLVDWQVGLDGEEWGTWALLLREDVTTSAGKDTVDTSHSLLWNLDLDQVDWLQESWVGQEGSGVQDTTGSWDNLSSSSVDGIGVEGNIHDVEADRAEWLLSNWTLTGSPLETGNDGILDFVEVLNSLGLINEQVGTGGVWAEAPNLTGIWIEMLANNSIVKGKE